MMRCWVGLGKWAFWKASRNNLITTMAPPQKKHPIVKRNKRGRPSLKQKRESETGVDLEEQDARLEELEHEYKDEAPIKRSIRIDPRQISNLTEQERKKIKDQHPQMNDYFTMSARDKSKFFHLLNQNYRHQIKLPEPPGSAPMKKTIRFKKRFEIKPFAYRDKCEIIQVKRSFMELYKAKDGAKSKPLSKFPKNL